MNEEGGAFDTDKPQFCFTLFQSTLNRSIILLSYFATRNNPFEVRTWVASDSRATH